MASAGGKGCIYNQDVKKMIQDASGIVIEDEKSFFDVLRSSCGFVILKWQYPSVDKPNMSLIQNISNFELSLSLIKVQNRYERGQNLTSFDVLRSNCGFVISNWLYPLVDMPNMSLIGNICNFELSLSLIDVRNRYERSQNLTSFNVLRSSCGSVISNW